jgi:16S rRNA (guanine(527)-N(7))-methyltransferase RsmG
MASSTQDLVASESSRLGLELAPREREDLAGYVDLLVRWGQRINLTGRPEAASIIQRQLPDGLHLAAVLRREAWGQDARSLLDAGAGAGTLGLVLALLTPSLSATLVEPSRRRCSFLRTAIHQLGLGQRVQVQQQRFQELELPQPDLIASRATWPAPRWLELAAPRVTCGQRVLAFVAAKPAPAAPAELQLEQEIAYALHDGAPRRVLVYQRQGQERAG